MSQKEDGTRDPYERCEESCKHNLAHGVLVNDELLREDGPHRPTRRHVKFGNLLGQREINDTTEDEH